MMMVGAHFRPQWSKYIQRGCLCGLIEMDFAVLLNQRSSQQAVRSHAFDPDVDWVGHTDTHTHASLTRSIWTSFPQLLGHSWTDVWQCASSTAGVQLCVCVCLQVNLPYPSIVQSAGPGRAPRCGRQFKQQQQRSTVAGPRAAHHVPLPHCYTTGQSRGDGPHTGTGEKHTQIPTSNILPLSSSHLHLIFSPFLDS